MATLEFELNAEPRTHLGKGESRRLRNAGKVPAIIYGGKDSPLPITLNQNELLRRLEHEAFYSHVLNIRLGDQTQRTILKDLHRHPARPIILHLDLQRIDANHKIHIRVPLHFLNETNAPGIKISGGRIAHLLTSIDVECLADNLPEHLDIDLGNLEIGQTLHLSDLQLPPGVSIRGLVKGSKDDKPVVTIAGQRTTTDAEPEAATPTTPPPAKAAPAKAPPAKAPAKAATPAKTAAKPAAKKP